MYKIIASDLDETLIGHNHKISDKDIQSIKSLKEENIFFVCATGRPFKSVDKTLDLLDLNDENQYVISFNGSVITKNKTHEIIHYDGLDFDTANSLYKKGLEYDVCIHVYTLNKTYVYNFTDEEKQYQKGRQELIETFEKDLEFIKDKKIIKVLYMNTDYNYLFKIEQEIKDLTKDVDISYSSNRFIEFNHKGVNKVYL